MTNNLPKPTPAGRLMLEVYAEREVECETFEDIQKDVIDGKKHVSDAVIAARYAHSSRSRTVKYGGYVPVYRCYGSVGVCYLSLNNGRDNSCMISDADLDDLQEKIMQAYFDGSLPDEIRACIDVIEEGE